MRKLPWEKMLFVFVACATALLRAEQSQVWRAVYATLKSPSVSDSAWTVVDTVALRFPDFSAHLLSGQIVALHAQTGVTGWLFEGEAVVRFAPRQRLEQQQLRRFTDDSVMVCAAQWLALRFWTPPPLAWGGSAGERPSISDETRQLDELVQSRLLLRRGYNLAARLLADYLNGARSEFVLCAFTPSSAADYSPPLYIYCFDPRESEEVRFYQSYEHRTGTPFHTLCSYSLQDAYHDSRDSLPAAPHLTRYNGWVEARPAQAEDIRVDMGIDIFLNHQPLPVLQMDISREFMVQNIRNERGDTLGFIQEPGEAAVTVALPSPLAIDTLRLLISYAGRGLSAGPSGDYYLSDPVYWLPRLGYLRRAEHKIVVKYPPGKRLVAVGKPSAPWRDGQFVLTYLDAHTPAKAYAFAFGDFLSDSLRIGSGVRIEVFSTPARSPAARRGLLASMQASLQFFEELLPTYPLRYLDILETPGVESQGLPGLVMLSGASFGQGSPEVMEMLRAHEVAHQWFGNMVGWATYHDQWLSEGIAEYLGALFVQARAKKQEFLQQRLSVWRADLMSEQRVALRSDWQRFGAAPLSVAKSDGRAAGPIWMGIRLAEKYGIDYYLQTYEKGAWVIHMIRRLLTDDATGSDAAFWDLLADFCTTFAQRDPSTFDFQETVERHTGMPMDWFFEQWLLGNDIPRYEWNTSLKKSSKNDFVLAGIVRQSGTSPDFRMPVPIALEFGKNERRIERVWVSGHETTFAFRLPKKPRRIVFNDGLAVLCEMQRKNLPISSAAFSVESPAR